jgi:hypothetical protein
MLTFDGVFSSSDTQNLLTNLFKCSKCLFISVASTISIIIDLKVLNSSLNNFINLKSKQYKNSILIRIKVNLVKFLKIFALSF